MHQDRIKHIINKKVDAPKKYVLYWMQQSQRVHYNHALQFAINEANKENLPLVVFFGIDDSYPEANLRHFAFMLEGLKEVQTLLNKLGITFILEIGNPVEQIKHWIIDSCMVVCDMGYSKIQRQWRQELFQFIYHHMSSVDCVMVESDLIVPVQAASNKVEYGAYTIRPKLMKLYTIYQDFHKIDEVKYPIVFDFGPSSKPIDVDYLLSQLSLDTSVSRSKLYIGGYSQASNRILSFIQQDLAHYLTSSDPSKNLTSKMSMYLHFGQISALEILDRVLLAYRLGQIDLEVKDAYIEQLLVRRELAFNFMYFNQNYDTFEQITEPWAYQTMSIHRFDEKEYIYTLTELENAMTHDVYFNAAMDEMVHTGFMQNYMRMYWAKKIIEWSLSFEDAYEKIKYLNNKYFIDGRDANSYAGIAWCFGKHDRPWGERAIFGKLRYMNAAGLERKFDISQYVAYVEQQKQECNNNNK
jgi:deoxyribodipyrimidine photo-lyase